MSLHAVKPEVLAIAAGELTRPSSPMSSANTTAVH